MRVFLFPLFPFHLAEHKDVQNFQNADGVDEQKSDKPVQIFLSRGLPKRNAFPRNRPNGRDDDNPRGNMIQKWAHTIRLPLFSIDQMSSCLFLLLHNESSDVQALRVHDDDAPDEDSSPI